MKKAFTSLCICAALSMVGCIDKSYDIADVSGEVTVGGQELVVPLADLDKISLGDILKESDYLNSNGEGGTYQITYSSYGDDPSKYELITVDGISIPAITGLSPVIDPIGFSFQELPTTLSMAGISQTFEVDYPTINRFVSVQPIKLAEELNLQLPISGQGTLSEQVLAVLKAQGLDVVQSSYASETYMKAEISLLEQLKKIEWVEFGCDKHPYGAPFAIEIDLQGMQDIVGGGTLKVNIEFPKGYHLRDEQGKDYPTATQNILSREIALQPKQKRVQILTHLYRIDFSDDEFEDGKLKINDQIKYSYDLSLNLGAGSYNLESMPKFSIEAAPEYKDVKVVINSFDLEGVSYPINYAFDGMPNGVSIDKVAFKDTYFSLSLKGLEWFKIIDDTTNKSVSAQINVTMPECMHFEESANFSNNTLSASAEELAQGIRLKLNYIDCKANGIKQENGQLLINADITAAIDLHEMDGLSVLVSSLTPPQEKLVVSVNIADTQLTLDTENTKVTWSGDQVYDLNLGSNIPSISQSIEVPDMIASIKKIEIGKANGNGEPVKIAFNLASSSAFPVDELEVDVAINLGKLLRPAPSSLASGIIKKSDNGDYILTIKEAWRPNEAPLAKEVAFEALENIPEIKDGKISLNQSFPVTGSVKIKEGQNIDLSKLDTAKIDIDVNIDDIEIRTFTGGINLSIAPEEMFVDLGDFSQLGVDINNLSINPILDIKLKDNPTNIPLSGDILVKTLDSNGNVKSTLDIPTINIAGSGATHIVLSTPRNAAKYEGVEGVTFLAVDGLSSLLEGGIPSKIAVSMKVETDKNDIRTIDLLEAKNGYNIEYQYSVVLPLEFYGTTDISYESSIGGLGETFAELADVTNGLKVGDVGLIAEIGTTIPFNIVLSAELINANGTTENIDACLNLNNSVIKGYTNEAECGDKSVSKIDIDFNLGDSHSLEGLRNADGVRFKFSLYNVADKSALKSSQFIDGKLKLRLRDGVTIDIFEFLNGTTEE